MDADSRNSEVYAAFWECCQPYTLPDRFSFLSPDPHVRACPADAQAALGHLTSKFSADELLAAGIVVRGDDSNVQMHSALAIPAEPIVALCASEDAPPFELLTNAGCLHRKEPSIFAVLNDSYTVSKMEGCAEAEDE